MTDNLANGQWQVHIFSKQSQISLSSSYHFIADICKENAFETVSVSLLFRLAGLVKNRYMR